MKARILEDNSFGGIYTDDFLVKNLKVIVNGQLVKDWNLTDIIPDTQNLFNPIFLNEAWVSSGIQNYDAEIATLREKTEFEIDAFISSHVQKFILRQVEIPAEIIQEYNAMREVYKVEKQIILDK